MKKTLLPLLFFFSLDVAWSQDAQYSQFYSNPLYLNPAYAGTAPNARIALNHRILWPNLPQAYNSTTLSADYNGSGSNSGFGLLVSQDTEGSASLQNTTASFIYSYQVNFNNKIVFRPALKFGYTFRDIDRSKLILGDQVDFGIDGVPSSDPSVNAIRLKNHWDIGAGALFYTKKYWLGIGLDHLTRPNRSVLEGSDPLAIRYSVHVGARFPLQQLVSTGSVSPTIAPSALYKRQGNFQQLDIGASVHLQPIILGMYYRGMPFISNDRDGRINQDALILLLGIEYANFEFGYSFDLNLSKLDPVATGGAHEFSLQYNFKIPHNPYKTPKKSYKLECPTFVKKLNN